MEQLYSEEVDKLTKTKKFFLLFIAVLFFTCLLAGSLTFFLKIRFIGWVQLLALFGLGVVYALAVQTKFSHQLGQGKLNKAIYFSLALLFSFSVIYLFQGQFDVLNVLGLSCAFLLPVSVLEAWNNFTAIPRTEKSVWYYSKDIPAETTLRYLENIKVKLKVVVDEAKEAELMTSLPATVELERVMYQVIKSQDPFKDGDGTFFKNSDQPYGWVFYTKKGFNKTYLIPDETLFENKIKPNTVIYAKRIG
jgi:hypothetical protein